MSGVYALFPLQAGTSVCVRFSLIQFRSYDTPLFAEEDCSPLVPPSLTLSLHNSARIPS
jgi:hypothetical protein